MKKYRPLLLLVLLLAFSCGLNNTMYNAEKYFRAAQARPLNASGRANNQAVEEYTKTIKKCGIILSDKKVRGNTDDALFLMAQALYYKGNSAFQAKDQFEALIKQFPDSPFYGEAHLLLAKVYREVNRKEDATKLLTEFIRDPAQKKLHPRALLTLAAFEITDKNYINAQYWLERIINEYPKAREYGEAFFLFGKNYFVQKDYVASQREFRKLSESRGIPGSLKLEARYYIATNQFMLQDYDASWRNVKDLLDDEDRPDKLVPIKVLKGRLLFARGEGELGVTEMQGISQAYPRTLSSAEAQYYLGEYYFYEMSDLDKALTAYNRVRVEFSTSDLVDLAQRKSGAITQLKQNTGLNPESNLQQFVDYYVSAAENYLNHFALPDSAWVMYQHIFDSRLDIRTLRDSLTIDANIKRAAIDSLNIEISLLPQPELPDSLVIVDSLNVGKETGIPVVIDSLIVNTEEVLQDSLAVADSLNEVLEMPDTNAPDLPDSLKQEVIIQDGEVIALPDSLIDVTSEMPALPDSLQDMDKYAEIKDPEQPDSLLITDKVEEPQEPILTDIERARELNNRLIASQTEITELETRLTNLDKLLQRYEKEIIPLVLFSQASIYSKTDTDTIRVAAIHNRMLEEYPENKYTRALGAMLEGRNIRLIDPAEELQEYQIDEAFGMYETQPDSMAVILKGLTTSEYSAIRLRSNFRLGWFYTFEQPDTTLAKTYLDEALKLEQSGDYATLVARFFDGTKFKLHTFEDLVDSLRVAEVADSLQAIADSAAVADSLKQTEEQKDAPAEEQIPEIKEEQITTPETTEVPEKKEEPLPEILPEVLPPPETDTVPPPPPPGDDSE